MSGPTRVTSDTSIVLLLDPDSVEVVAGAAVCDLASAQGGAAEALALATEAMADAAAAQSTADDAQADATVALGALAALDTDGVANVSGVAGATATAALDNLLADVATRATAADLSAETAARIAADALLAPLASPALTGNPTAPTPATSDNDTSVATTAMVQAVAALLLRMFNSGGAVSGARAWYGTATTDASGNWTADVSAAGFSAPPTVWVSGELNTATVVDQVWATVRTRSATSIAGSALRGQTLVALGATLRAAAAGATVHVLAVGV